MEMTDLRDRKPRLFEHGDVRVTLDADGFLVQPDVWTEDVARALAAADGLDPLTEDHWKVMRYVRAYWEERDVAPMIRRLCRETGFTLKQIYLLFPDGPANGACRYAGLPKPEGCV